MVISKGYKKLLVADGNVDFLEGTTFAGKTTTSVSTKFLYKVKTTKRKKHIIAAESLGVIVSNILSTGDAGLCDNFPDIQIYLSGNSKQPLPHIKIGEDVVFLVGYDNIARFKKVLGGQFGAVLVDEMNIANFKFLQELFLPRFEYFLGTLNPDNPNKDVYKKLINRSRPVEGHDIPKHMEKELKTAKPKEGWNYWFFTYNDNPTITEERVNELKTSLLPGTIEYRTKILGVRTKNTDLIFGDIPKECVVDKNFIDKKKFINFASAIDTSYSSKTEDTNVFGFGGLTSDNAYIRLDEIVINNKDIGKTIKVGNKSFTMPLATTDVCWLAYEFLESKKEEYGFVREIVIDSPATTLEFNKMARTNGWIYKAVSANTLKHKVKIIDRISFLSNWLAKRKYFIYEKCKAHISELEAWSYDKNGNAEDYGNHTIDECCYEWIPYRKKIGL